MSAAERRAADRKFEAFRDKIDQTADSVRCECGSYRIESSSSFDDKRRRIVRIEYRCRECGAQTTVLPRRRDGDDLD